MRIVGKLLKGEGCIHREGLLNKRDLLYTIKTMSIIFSIIGYATPSF
ncbi:hypothetical protein [Lysinibacillus sp. NPDC093692]|nr:hypothetical protein SAMN06295926_113123 [Lysinibacillus sp. AC-3]